MVNEITSICHAMVLCDGLYQSPSTGKISLLDTIGNLLAANDFPQPWSTIVVYFALTSGHGPTTLTLRWMGPDEKSPPGAEQYMEIDFANPLEMWEVHFSC